MDTVTLLQYLRKINKKHKNKYNIGVYAADKLPLFPKLPFAYILNDQEAFLPGAHWSAIYANSGTIEYFCSFGLPPRVVYHKHFIKKNGKKYVFNRKTLQNITSKECGKWCLLFLESRMRGISMKKFLHPFGKNTFKNDIMCREYFKKIARKY
jgi:hypothetical protein